MNNKILELFKEKQVCVGSFETAEAMESINKGWQECNQGVLMLGLIQTMELCGYLKQVISILLEAESYFGNKDSYRSYNDAVELKMKTNFREMFVEKHECQFYLDKLHALARQMVLIYLPNHIDSVERRLHIPWNEAELAKIVRKYIPQITDEEVLTSE